MSYNWNDMRVVLGSTNPDKKRILEEVLRPHFEDFKIVSVSVLPGISDQPFGEEVIAKGAINRAKAAFGKNSNCDFSVGMEAGLHRVGQKGYFLVAAVAICEDSQNVFLGISSKIELPIELSKEIEKGGFFGEIIREFRKKTKSENLNQLVDELISRKKVFKEAIDNALVCYLNKEHYQYRQQSKD